MATVDMFEQIGFADLEAGDGAEALALLQQHPESKSCSRILACRA